MLLDYNIWDYQRKITVNVKMKMYTNADSKCTILAKAFEIEYNLSGSDENELQKRHFIKCTFIRVIRITFFFIH